MSDTSNVDTNLSLWKDVLSEYGLTYFFIGEFMYVDTGSEIFPIKYQNYDYKNIYPSRSNLSSLYRHTIYFDELDIVQRDDGYIDLVNL